MMMILMMKHFDSTVKFYTEVIYDLFISLFKEMQNIQENDRIYLLEES